jgi:hypothetical protein
MKWALLDYWRRRAASGAMTKKIDGESLSDAQTPAPTDGGYTATPMEDGFEMTISDPETYSAFLQGTTNERTEMTDEPSAAKTLDSIRTGGGNSLITVRQRLAEALHALDCGEFQLAHGRISEAVAFLGPLASAERAFCVAASSFVIRAAEIEPGMVMAQVGPVTSVERSPCGHEECPGHFLIKIEQMEEPVMIDGDTCIYIERDEPSGPEPNA